VSVVEQGPEDALLVLFFADKTGHRPEEPQLLSRRWKRAQAARGWVARRGCSPKRTGWPSSPTHNRLKCEQQDFPHDPRALVATSATT